MTDLLPLCEKRMPCTRRTIGVSAVLEHDIDCRGKGKAPRLMYKGSDAVIMGIGIVWISWDHRLTRDTNRDGPSSWPCQVALKSKARSGVAGVADRQVQWFFSLNPAAWQNLNLNISHQPRILPNDKPPVLTHPQPEPAPQVRDRWTAYAILRPTLVQNLSYQPLTVICRGTHPEGHISTGRCLEQD